MIKTYEIFTTTHSEIHQAKNVIEAIEKAGNPDDLIGVQIADTAAKFAQPPYGREGLRNADDWLREYEILRREAGIKEATWELVQMVKDELLTTLTAQQGYTKSQMEEWLDSDNGLDQYAVEKVKEFLSSLSPAPEQ